MQDQGWALRTVGNGRTHENLSTADAIRAIRRAMHGLDPFDDDSGSREKQSTQQHDVRVAA